MKLRSILVDSSVVLSACKSTSGASYFLHYLGHNNQLKIFVNRTILKETTRRIDKIGKSNEYLKQFLSWSNIASLPNPSSQSMEEYKQTSPDPDDVHLFASAKKLPGHTLVSLDKKHVLSVREKIPDLTILSPGELLQELRSTNL